MDKIEVNYVYNVDSDSVYVYDGDTITCWIDLGFNIGRKEKFRLLGIDTPELRGEEREEGLVSRDFLRELIKQGISNKKDIMIKTKKDRTGKYGRYLATLYIGEVNVNELLLKEGYAKVYGKKGKQ